MGNAKARTLMQNAWATRRSSFDKPAEEKTELMTRARDDLARAVALCREASDPVELAQALHMQANLERDLRRNDEALELWLEAVDVLREAGDPLQLAHKLRHLGDLRRECKRFEEADRCYEEAAALYRSHAEPGSLDHANAIRPMAMLKERMGDRARARALWSEARELYAAVNIQGLDTRITVEECDRQVERLAAVS